MSPSQYFATLQVQLEPRVGGILFSGLLRPWKFEHQGDGFCARPPLENLIEAQLALTGAAQALRKNGFTVAGYSIGKIVMSSERSDPLGLLEGAERRPAPRPSLERGSVYEHRDGRKGVLISSHPHDGALLIFNQVDHPEDNILEFFACERSDLVGVPK